MDLTRKELLRICEVIDHYKTCEDGVHMDLFEIENKIKDTIK